MAGATPWTGASGHCVRGRHSPRVHFACCVIYSSHRPEIGVRRVTTTSEGVRVTTLRPPPLTPVTRAVHTIYTPQTNLRPQLVHRIVGYDVTKIGPTDISNGRVQHTTHGCGMGGRRRATTTPQREAEAGSGSGKHEHHGPPGTESLPRESVMI